MSTEKITVNMAEMTLEEMAVAADQLGEQAKLAGYIDGDGNPLPRPGDNFRTVYAYAWVWKRRTDPTFSFEDAMRLGPGDVEVTTGPEAGGAGNGATPLVSPVPGISTPPT